MGISVKHSEHSRIVETKLGPVIGLISNELLYVRGLRYAQAKRFQVPQPVAPWAEPVDCTEKGPICPQLPFRFEFVLGDMNNRRAMDEDCLTVSVITPADAPPDAKLPVVVWYHGGAFISGAADLDIMDPSDIARRGVTVVCVQYRLGIFGCLAVDGIAPANLAIQDQVMSLQWVHKNIEIFGGDPARVTIMGQSAGAASVYALMLAEGTEGLFERAILISGPIGMLHGDKSHQKALGARAREVFEGSAISATSMPSEEVLKIQAKLDEARSRGGMAYGFTWGRHPLPMEEEVESELKALAARIQLLIGWTADDALPFIFLIPFGKRLAQLPVVGAFIAFMVGKLLTYYIFRKPSQKLHSLWRASGGRSTTYSFDWFPPGNPLRACHCMEMPFLFGTWQTWEKLPIVAGDRSKEIVGHLAPRVKDFFVEFIEGKLVSDKHIGIDEKFLGIDHQ